MAIVEAVFKQYGFTGFAMGIEAEVSGLYEAIKAQTDPTSIMLRFRPDRVQVKTAVRSVLCEVKSESGKYENFAIEVNAYRAAQLWNQTGKHVMIALVDLKTRTASAAWFDDLPTPSLIYIPERWDYIEQRTRLQKEWDRPQLQPVAWKGGSGTPYWLLPKNSPALQPLATFVADQLTGPPVKLKGGVSVHQERIEGVIKQLEIVLVELRALTTPSPVAPTPALVTLEQVRTVLTEKSRQGKTTAVRALLERYGAVKLTAVAPQQYRALLEEAQKL